MTHSVGRQSGAPFVSGPGATNNVTNNFTGGPWTFIRTHVDSSAETLATWRLDEDTSSKIEILNDASTNLFFLPSIRITGPTTNRVLTIYGRATTDTGTAPILSFDAATSGGGAISTRPLFAWYNNATLQSILSSGGVFKLGGTSATLYSRLGQKLETNTLNDYGGAALNTWYSSGPGCSLLDFAKSRGAAIGTHTIVQSGDTLGAAVFRGSDGTAFRNAAVIKAEVDGTPGASDMPGRLVFSTTPDGSVTESERMRITNAGDVGIGKTPTTGIQLDLNGQLGLKSYTVATLPSASVQAGAIVYASDAGGNGPCIAMSNGTNWKRCDNTGTTVS